MKLLDTMLTNFVQNGQLTVIDGNAHTYGHGSADAPRATIQLTDKSLYRKLFLNPELYAGEAYMDGTLICKEGGIRELLRIFAFNRIRLRKQPMQKVLRRWLKKIRRFHQKNKQAVSRKNVQHHYDLSNEFYQLFLDEDLNYSCAYYEDPNMSLEQAQIAKKYHIAQKLNLQPGLEVLDIGCGWGSMAIYLAENYDCHVTGITLSKEQYDLANQRVTEKNLNNKVAILLQDISRYR